MPTEAAADMADGPPCEAAEDGDDALVRRAAAGEQAAWRTLVDRHLRTIVGAAWYSLGDRSEAEDIAQESFVRLMRKSAEWQPGGASVRTWLYRVALNLCTDRHRARRTSLKHQADAVAEAFDAEPGMDRTLDQKRWLRRALDELPERQRSAVLLVFHQGLSNREAAAILDVSVDALESLLARARRRLRQRLDPVIDDLLGAVQ